MPLVTMKELLEKAEKNSKAVGAFSVGNMEMIMGAVRAAEETETPIILQIAEKRLPYSPLELIGPMMIAAAENSETDICVHLDHGLTYETVCDALDLGFTSVMLDSSALPLEENIEATVEVVETAAEYGVTVEAELGLVGGAEGGACHEIQCTDPDIAKRYCDETGIDALAVAIGNAHGRYPTLPELRFDILEKINKECSVPLVLHGGTGITPADFRRCIENGVRKINIATASFEAVVKASEASAAQKLDYFAASAATVDAVCENVKKHIEIFNMR